MDGRATTTLARSRLIDRLLEVDSAAGRDLFVEQHRNEFDLSAVQVLKSRIDHLMRADQAKAAELVDIMLRISSITGSQEQRALGLVAAGNVRLIAHGEFGVSVDLYDQAAAIYMSLGKTVEHARSQIGRVAALASLGRYSEAIRSGEQALEVLERHDRFDLIVGLASNLGLAYSHSGDDARSLQMFDRAAQVYRQLNDKIDSTSSLIQMNRSFALRTMGRYTEAISAGTVAIQGFSQAAEPAEAARARLHLALTYYLMGHYARALNLLQESRDEFSADGRMHDIAQVDLFRSDCLLELRRFDEVVDLCGAVRRDFADKGAIDLVAQVFVNEAVALTQLGQHQKALESLHQAQLIFETSDNQLWLRATRLKSAQVLRVLGRYQECLDRATELAKTMLDGDLKVDAAHAHLVAGQASMDLGLPDAAEEHLEQALSLVELADLPDLTYQAELIRGTLLTMRGLLLEASNALELALRSLERLGGRMMLEHRVSFLEDKAEGYTAAILLAIELGDATLAMEYAERAKSRALIDMVSNRVDIGIRIHSAEDQDLVRELTALRAERANRYRKREAEMLSGERGRTPFGPGEDMQSISVLEAEITRRWHQLLLRDPAYARDASLWQARVEPVQPHLDPDSVLLEYYIAGKELVVFVVTATDTVVHRFSFDPEHLHHLVNRLRLNLGTVPRLESSELPALRRNADRILGELSEEIFDPIADTIPAAGNLIIVPHGPLHYVPFHALRDREGYLLESRCISYLPSASVLAYCHQVKPRSGQSLAVGYSSGGELPHAVLEANQVASALSGETLLEGRATFERVEPRLAKLAVLHVAAHGDFRADNPLFSGLTLADQELTVLDVFGLELHTSLVTLSACRTGQSVVGGGDELLGLMRAFLAAGTASIVLTLWSVEDRSTSQLMERFYSELVAGATKPEALRAAQLALLRGELTKSPSHLHPYYWAPFLLVGDVRVLDRPTLPDAPGDSRDQA